MNNKYTPTKKDIERIKINPNKLKVSGDSVFATLQGEGITAGLPAVFIRLHFCNLACGSRFGWKCDTGYTWDTSRKEFWKEPEDWGYEESANKIKKAWNDKFGTKKDAEKRVVITGGEPLLQQQKIAKLIKFLPDWKVEIETNGTIEPIKLLYSCQFNCSPKLENSGNLKQRRYKPSVLKKINSLKNSWFKFVVITSQDLLEIKQIIKDCSLKKEKILIMPEGWTKEEVEKHIKNFESDNKKNGWKITLRNQLIWFGQKRRT